jgi:hypothetical protein
LAEIQIPDRDGGQSPIVSTNTLTIVTPLADRPLA